MSYWEIKSFFWWKVKSKIEAPVEARLLLMIGRILSVDVEIKLQVPWRQELGLFCSLLFPQSLAQCLSHEKPVRHIYWMNKMKSWVLSTRWYYCITHLSLFRWHGPLVFQNKTLTITCSIMFWPQRISSMSSETSHIFWQIEDSYRYLASLLNKRAFFSWKGLTLLDQPWRWFEGD